MVEQWDAQLVDQQIVDAQWSPGGAEQWGHPELTPDAVPADAVESESRELYRPKMLALAERPKLPQCLELQRAWGALAETESAVELAVPTIEWAPPGWKAGAEVRLGLSLA